MATRFYLPNTGAAAVSPAFSATWNTTSAADRMRCVIARINSAMNESARTITSTATSPELGLGRQYVSDPIAAQTISGTLKGQMRAAVNAAAYNGTVAIGARVVSNDGITVRGTLLDVTAADATSTPPRIALSTRTNRKFMDASESASISLTSVDAQDGDRIVIEIGARDVTTSITNLVRLALGDDSATDLPEDETTTTANNPWVEFSGDILFINTIKQLSALGVG